MQTRLNSSQLCYFFEQLSNMQEGGISILNALKALGELKPKNVARLAQTLALQIETGETFSQAMSGHPRIFSPLMVHLIQAGEASGRIETLCLENARILSQKIETRRALIQKAAYPCLILVSSLFLLPLPQLIGPSDLTASQKLHIYLLHNVYPLIAGFVAILFLQDAQGGETLRKLKGLSFHLPLLGPPLKNKDLAQFLQTFALCQNAHIRADSAAKLALETLSCQKTKEKLKDMPKRILQGEAPSAILSSQNILSWDLLSLITTGEKSGRTAENLLLAARELEKKSLHSLSIYLQLSGPILLLVVGGIIALQVARSLANSISQLQG